MNHFHLNLNWLGFPVKDKVFNPRTTAEYVYPQEVNTGIGDV